MPDDWKLSERERIAMNLLVEWGSCKIVAMEMGITAPAMSDKLKTIRQRQGIRTNMLLALEYDRLNRNK